MDTLLILLTISLGVHLTTVVITTINYFLIACLRANTTSIASSPPKKVSVLIPARNEEKAIEKCVSGFLKQDYPNLEVIVLNDNSQDGTESILHRIRDAGHQKKLKVLQGKPLEAGWIGKNFACKQLAESSTGDYLAFFDADVWVASDQCITRLISFLERKENSHLEVLTAFPYQYIDSLSQMPVMSAYLKTIFSIFPMFLNNHMRFKGFFGLSGQCIVFKRKTYEKFGGHELVKDCIVEDMEFGRQLKHLQIPYKYISGKGILFCQMYDGFAAGWSGFKKNFYEAARLDPNISIGLPLLFILRTAIPLLTFGLVLFTDGLVSRSAVVLDVVCLVLPVLITMFVMKIFTTGMNPLYQILVYYFEELTILVFLFGAIRDGMKGQLVWKGRVYPSSKPRLLSKVHLE